MKGIMGKKDKERWGKMGRTEKVCRLHSVGREVVAQNWKSEEGKHYLFWFKFFISGLFHFRILIFKLCYAKVHIGWWLLPTRISQSDIRLVVAA